MYVARSLAATLVLLIIACSDYAGSTEHPSATADDNQSDSVAVVVPGRRDTTWLTQKSRLCTLAPSKLHQRLTAVFDSVTAKPLMRPSVQSRREAQHALQRRLGGLLDSVRWDSGTTIRVAFINGERELQRRVLSAAQEWSNYANITFTAVEDRRAAQLRVKFTSDDKSWSYVGRDALGVARPDSQTIQFGWLLPESSDEELREVVLHEFGHALGLIHEHQQPNAAAIPWNRAKVYAYYWYNYQWTPDDVDSQVLALYSTSATRFTEVDPYSIMLYAIPAELTDGRFATDWNTILSQRDKEFIASIYPR